jgi:hypothetical protein
MLHLDRAIRLIVGLEFGSFLSGLSLRWLGIVRVVRVAGVAGVAGVRRKHCTLLSLRLRYDYCHDYYIFLSLTEEVQVAPRLSKIW